MPKSPALPGDLPDDLRDGVSPVPVTATVGGVITGD